jgi:hypothetical protein
MQVDQYLFYFSAHCEHRVEGGMRGRGDCSVNSEQCVLCSKHLLPAQTQACAMRKRCRATSTRVGARIILVERYLPAGTVRRKQGGVNLIESGAGRQALQVQFALVGSDASPPAGPAPPSPA